MLLGLKQQIREGKKIELTLTLRYKNGKSGKVKFQAPARALDASSSKPMHDMPAAGGHDMAGSGDIITQHLKGIFAHE